MLLHSVPSIFNAGHNWNLWELWRDLKWEGFRVVCWICLVPILLPAIEWGERYPKIWLKLAKQTSIYTHYLCSSLCLIWSHAMPILVKTRTLCSVPSSLVQLLQWWKRAAYVSYCAHLWMCTATLLQTLRVIFSIVFSLVWDSGIARFVHVSCTPTQGTSYSSIRAIKP